MLKKYSPNKIINKINKIIKELELVKQEIKDNEDFNEVLMTEEISLSKFKESEKTLKSSKNIRNTNLENEYKEYMDKNSMPDILF